MPRWRKMGLVRRAKVTVATAANAGGDRSAMRSEPRSGIEKRSLPRTAPRGTTHGSTDAQLSPLVLKPPSTSPMILWATRHPWTLKRMMVPVEYAPSLRNTASEPTGRVGSIDLPATATNVTHPVRERIAAEAGSRSSAADRRE